MTTRSTTASRASYISDRLDLVELEIEATRDALLEADLTIDEFNRIRKLLTGLSEVIDRAHDTPDRIYRILSKTERN